MYLAVDIGGTKTLVALLSDDGQIVEQRRFPSDHDYDAFLRNLEDNFKRLSPAEGALTGCVGVPGLITRDTGIVHALGNLPWREKPIRNDIAQICNAELIIENDARLGGLSEAQLVKDEYQDVLFATISTGIGGALIKNGRIVTALQDTEFGKMPLLFEGHYTNWEDFAGGRGIVEAFGKQASEITDPADWRVIGERLAYGLGVVCSTLQPEVIILGGSVGVQASKFDPVIMEFLEKHLHPVVRRPKAVIPAQRPDEAVVFGCYDLAKQRFGGGDE